MYRLVLTLKTNRKRLQPDTLWKNGKKFGRRPKDPSEARSPISNIFTLYCLSGFWSSLSKSNLPKTWVIESVLFETASGRGDREHGYLTFFVLRTGITYWRKWEMVPTKQVLAAFISCLIYGALMMHCRRLTEREEWLIAFLKMVIKVNDRAWSRSWMANLRIQKLVLEQWKSDCLLPVLLGNIFSR